MKLYSKSVESRIPSWLLARKTTMLSMEIYIYTYCKKTKNWNRRVTRMLLASPASSSQISTLALIKSPSFFYSEVKSSLSDLIASNFWKTSVCMRVSPMFSMLLSLHQDRSLFLCKTREAIEYWALTKRTKWSDKIYKIKTGKMSLVRVLKSYQASTCMIIHLWLLETQLASTWST